MIPKFRIVTNGERFSVEYVEYQQLANDTVGLTWHYISQCAEFPYSQSSARRTFDSVDAARKWIDDWESKVAKMQKTEIWMPI